jgi:hypothetical protein
MESQIPDDRPRDLSERERQLVERLIVLGGANELHESLKTIKVVRMNDGGMGSLRFVNTAHPSQPQRMGRSLSKLEFDDADGVKVIASLDLDESGNLFELDLWKVDFTPLIELPEL